MKCPVCAAVLPFLWALPALALDQNGNGQSDVWEMVYGVSGLAAAGDADADGWSNAQESAAGTHPLDPASHPAMTLQRGAGGTFVASWPGLAGKKYAPLMSPTLAAGSWTPAAAEMIGIGGVLQLAINPAGASRAFFRIEIADRDLDGDGVADWEELAVGFDPTRVRTERRDPEDDDRVTAGLTAANTITVATYDEACSERWSDPALFVVRRSGGLQPLTVNVTFAGSATRDFDYSTTPSGSTVSFPPGVREVFVEVQPLADADDGEATETVMLTVNAGAGYTVGAQNSATVSLLNETAASLPSAKAAARFLIQAAFGPDQDASADADHIPENVEEAMALGYEAWIDDQFTRPLGLIQPWTEWAVANASAMGLHGNYKEFAWWSRVMGAPKLRPDAATTQLPDPLRQRVAFGLSEILVVSDRPEMIAVEQVGMANYYDLMVQHAFGNYRDLLYAVATHPVMGVFLSHLGNQKQVPGSNVFPDENFAREIMQLFTIGLWELNPDGTRQLGTDGQPIATYDNSHITELARVFTGFTFAGTATFALDPRKFDAPMKCWDAFHDCNPKMLLGGLQLPARTPSPGNTGTAGLADVDAAVGNLFAHPNVGPFVGRQLIQRLVTSNPSPGYVARVAAAFANNGSGVRGDMKAVVKAILLDPEARDAAMMTQPTWGRLREPLLRVVNLARAFNAASTSGHYPLDQFVLDHLQDPLNAPSVFNFFLPTHSPPGPLTQMGLVAPEFQILNASSAITGPNYFWNAIPGGLHRWGAGQPQYAVRLNLDQELAMIVPAGQVAQDVPAGPAADPDPLLRRLDLALTGGTLSPRQFQIIREAMVRVGPPTWQWHRERLRLAIYLIVTSPDFNVLR